MLLPSPSELGEPGPRDALRRDEGPRDALGSTAADRPAAGQAPQAMPIAAPLAPKPARLPLAAGVHLGQGRSRSDPCRVCSLGFLDRVREVDFKG